MKKLKLFMSPVQYRQPAFGSSNDSNPNLYFVKEGDRQLYWLDELLDGGLSIPEEIWPKGSEDPKSTFIILLTGAPGTGKSTFALELCINLISKEQDDNQKHWTSVYYSLETPTSRLVESARSFGWESGFIQTRADSGPFNKERCCILCGKENLLTNNRTSLQPHEYLLQLKESWSTKFKMNGENGKYRNTPDILVIDSLNVLREFSSTSRVTSGANITQGGGAIAFHEIVAKLTESETDRPRILLLVLDSNPQSAELGSAQFMADVIFSFEGATGLEDYYQRSFEISKIRTQTHALGRHTLKILPGAKEAGQLARPDSAPYLERGCTYIFPSLHWHLSKSIRSQPENANRRQRSYSTSIGELDRTLAKDEAHQGFPQDAITGLVGSRGAMKSHLAYFFALKHLMGFDDEPSKNVLLISLRDNIDETKVKLSTIAGEEGMCDRDISESRIDILLQSDKLEILYNWPGNVSPGEFFHRILVALRRPRDVGAPPTGAVPITSENRRTAEIVIVEGLDHIEAKFPLLARERLFVPALVSLFKRYKTCAVITSAQSKGAEGGWSNIRPMSDLLLEFSEANDTDRANKPKDAEQVTKVSVERVPAGQIGGSSGILYRGPNQPLDFKNLSP